MRTRRKQETIDGEAAKYCTKCGSLKQLSEFYKDARYVDGTTSACKSCRIATTLTSCYTWRDKNRAKVNQHERKRRREKLHQKYGVELSSMEVVLEAQGGLCSICKIPISFEALNKRTVPHVDHDHVTGSFRGLLCLTCNTGLGMFNDSATLLESAIQYLRTSVQRERASELAPDMGDAVLRSHENKNREKLAEMTSSDTIQ